MGNTLLPGNETQSVPTTITSGKERAMLAAFSIISILLLFTKWFHLPGLGTIYGETDFSGVGLITVHHFFPDGVLDIERSELLLPAVCQGLCIILHISTLLLLLFGERVNEAACSGASALVSLAVTMILFCLYFSNNVMFLTEWFYLFAIVTVLNMTFSARVALGHKML